MFSDIGKFLNDKFRHIFTKEFFVSNVLIPSGMLTLIFFVFSWMLPGGVNQVFMARSGRYLLPITIFLYLAFIAFIVFRGANKPFFESQEEHYSIKDLILFLLPLGPVVQYILNNLDALTPFGFILTFIVCLLFTAVFVFIIPILLRKTGSTRMMMALGLALTFSIFNMASLSSQFSWYSGGDLFDQALVFGIVFLVCFLPFHFNSRSMLKIWIALYFVVNTFFQVLTLNKNQPVPELEKADNKLVKLIGSREPVTTPNIYLLIYDAYVANETMLTYGIDNQAQEQYLEGLGFQLYPHSYSVAASSIESMSRVFNVSVDHYGKSRQGVSGDGVVQNLLNEFGYKTYGVFPSNYFFRGIEPGYDNLYPNYVPIDASSTSFFIESIFMGEFRFDAGFDEVSTEQFIEQKSDIFNEVPREPRFFYMHSTFPGHSQNSGICLPNEVELFEERLSQANFEMRQDVESIIENDPTAIVIVAGDHGPYLTKNCDYTYVQNAYNTSEISRIDIQDRFGTFLAIRWPTGETEEYKDIHVLQDMFPAIFSYMFQDPTLMGSRIEPVTLEPNSISGAAVENGVIRGGINDGEPLFIGSDS